MLVGLDLITNSSRHNTCFLFCRSACFFIVINFYFWMSTWTRSCSRKIHVEYQVEAGVLSVCCPLKNCGLNEKGSRFRHQDSRSLHHPPFCSSLEGSYRRIQIYTHRRKPTIFLFRWFWNVCILWKHSHLLSAITAITATFILPHRLLHRFGLACCIIIPK